jgi:hypothetical protein
MENRNGNCSRRDARDAMSEHDDHRKNAEVKMVPRGRPTHSFAETREGAMVAFAKSWRRGILNVFQ